MQKPSPKLTIPIIIALVACLSSGCSFITDAHHALNYFCPKLDISVNGVHESYDKDDNIAVRSIVIEYFGHDDRTVENYFDRDKSYRKINNDNYSDLNSSDNTFIEESDSTAGRVFKVHGDSAIVIFNRTRKEIIIIEYFINHKQKKRLN